MKLKVKATKTDYLFSKVTKNWNDMLNKTKQKNAKKICTLSAEPTKN